jgi:hypothetical protein
LVPNQHLVLFTDGSGETELDKAFRQANAESTWAFVLRDLGAGRTRLVVRWQAFWDLRSSALSLAIGLALDPIEFIMEQKMMRGIKERAESTALGQTSGSGDTGSVDSQRIRLM